MPDERRWQRDSHEQAEGNVYAHNEEVARSVHAEGHQQTLKDFVVLPTTVIPL